MPLGCRPILFGANPFRQLRHGSKARYGWVANPYRKPLLISLPTGTFTLKDTPSFARRDNDKAHWRRCLASSEALGLAVNYIT